MFREAGDLVRLLPGRRLRGDREGRRHHLVPAGAGRDARGLRPLLLLAFQRRGRFRPRPRTQWSVTITTIHYQNFIAYII